jgi:hypothetical protein
VKSRTANTFTTCVSSLLLSGREEKMPRTAAIARAEAGDTEETNNRRSSGIGRFFSNRSSETVLNGPHTIPNIDYGNGLLRLKVNRSLWQFYLLIPRLQLRRYEPTVKTPMGTSSRKFYLLNGMADRRGFELGEVQKSTG